MPHPHPLSEVVSININESVDFLEKHKHLAGLHKFKIIVATTYKKDEDSLAEFDISPFTNLLKIQLTHKFKEEPKDKQEEALIHELYHARLDLMKKEFESIVDSAMEHVEEMLANDLERGWRTMQK